jgi:hypothetical protein
MPDHEYFRELSALAAIGQLSSEEDTELGQHLIDCESCREASAAYAHVIQHQLPQADPIRWRMKSLVPQPSPDIDVRHRFLARARVEGVELTAEAEEACRSERKSLFWVEWRWQPILATAAITAALVMGLTTFRSRQRNAPVAAANGSGGQWVTEKDALEKRIATLEVEESVRASSVKAAEAERESAMDRESLVKVQNQLVDMQEEARKLATDLEKSRSQYVELAKANQEKDALVANLRSQNEREHKENVSNLSTVIIQEGRIREITESLQQQASNFERERQLMTASTDVRQLMGARNLHIMDVHDTDGAGKSAKSFGRVFYAEGQSLIFYAFDLPSGRLTPAKYTFQAWGQRESVSHSVRNLGTFAVDDHEQRRWVLKVNDPKLLQGIDSVFVTAEALGDIREPRGKKLLYAYIVGEPNHP